MFARWYGLWIYRCRAPFLTFSCSARKSYCNANAIIHIRCAPKICTKILRLNHWTLPWSNQQSFVSVNKNKLMLGQYIIELAFVYVCLMSWHLLVSISVRDHPAMINTNMLLSRIQSRIQIMDSVQLLCSWMAHKQILQYYFFIVSKRNLKGISLKSSFLLHLFHWRFAPQGLIGNKRTLAQC